MISGQAHQQRLRELQHLKTMMEQDAQRWHTSSSSSDEEAEEDHDNDETEGQQESDEESQSLL